MTKSQRGVLVSFYIKANAPQEAHKLRELIGYQPVKQEHFFLANQIASLQAIHDIESGDLPDINHLASILFEAGRITGIRQERARKRGA